MQSHDGTVPKHRIAPGRTARQFFAQVDRSLWFLRNTGVLDNAVFMIPLRIGRSELRSLAKWALENDSAGLIAAFYGTSYMPLTRLGFTRYDHPSGPKARMDHLFMVGLLALYSPDGLKRLKRGRMHLSSSAPQMWISRRELLRMYGPKKSPSENVILKAESASPPELL
jgi:hypothetical protein